MHGQETVIGAAPDSIMNSLSQQEYALRILNETLPEDCWKEAFEELYGEFENSSSELVTTLIFSHKGLSGEIPKEIGLLSCLKTVNMESNIITGKIPVEIANLLELKELNLCDNQINGRIPPDFSRLSNLIFLRLHTNQICDCIPNELGCISSLMDLDLHNNQISGRIPLELGFLSNLLSLRLQDNQLTGPIPPELGLLSSLVEINLSNNQLTGSIPAELGQLLNIFYFSISGNSLTGNIPKELGLLSHARQLCLSNNQLSSSIPAELQLLSNLVLLDVSNNNISGVVPEGLFGLKNLKMDFFGNDDLSWEVSFSVETPQFHLHVLPREKLLTMERLMDHETVGVYCDAGRESTEKFWRRDGVVEVLQNTSKFYSWSGLANEGLKVLREEIVFISHKWLGNDYFEPHPDDESNSKLKHLQSLARKHLEWKYFWIDFLCIPQKNKRSKMKGIYSLPHFIKCCGTLVALCGSDGEARLEVYLSRGWCRLEQLCSAIEVFFENGQELCLATTKLLFANKDTGSLDNMAQLSDLELNPLLGVFSDDEIPQKGSIKDRSRVRKCVKLVCQSLIKQSSQHAKLAEKILACPGFRFNCPLGHGLRPGVIDDSDEYWCNVCQADDLTRSENVFGCRLCRYDVCELCAPIEPQVYSMSYSGRALCTSKNIVISNLEIFFGSLSFTFSFDVSGETSLFLLSGKVQTSGVVNLEQVLKNDVHLEMLSSWYMYFDFDLRKLKTHLTVDETPLDIEVVCFEPLGLLPKREAHQKFRASLLKNDEGSKQSQEMYWDKGVMKVRSSLTQIEPSAEPALFSWMLCGECFLDEPSLAKKGPETSGLGNILDEAELQPELVSPVLEDSIVLEHQSSAPNLLEKIDNTYSCAEGASTSRLLDPQENETNQTKFESHNGAGLLFDPGPTTNELAVLLGEQENGVSRLATADLIPQNELVSPKDITESECIQDGVPPPNSEVSSTNTAHACGCCLIS